MQLEMWYKIKKIDRKFTYLVLLGGAKGVRTSGVAKVRRARLAEEE